MNSIPLKQQQLWPYQKKKHPTPNQPWYCDTKLCRYPSTCKKNQRKGLIKLIKSKCQICLRNITTAKWEKNEIVHTWFQNSTLSAHTYTFLNYYYLLFIQNQLRRAGYCHSSLFIYLTIEAWENIESWW